MIEVEHLSKWYGSTQAVAELSFRVDKGEVVGFLGPNGAGKSTTLRILAGFLGATSGRVRIAGHDLAEEAMLAREKVGYMPEMSPLYPEMRVSEYLGYRAELKRIGRRRRDAVERAMSQAKVSDVESVRIGHLSKGYRQRVGLADALLGSPPLLILDEPTAGLDPNQIREVRALIRALGKEHTVLLSTHILPEVEATCSRVLVIARGRLVAQGSIDEIRTMRRSSAVRIRARGEPEQALIAMRRVRGVRTVQIEDRDAAAAEGDTSAGAGTFTLSIEFRSGADGPKATEEIVQALVAAHIRVREVVPRKVTLEQVFSDLTASPADSEAKSGGNEAGGGESTGNPAEPEDPAGGDDVERPADSSPQSARGGP
jgi:ABC-2 type transport system ATP-binding protein